MKYDCLIVDDEIELAEATSEYFNMFEVKTAYVSDSQGCMEFLQNNEVSLILLDINLENESGFDLCKKLRDITNIPILFISARQSDDDVLIALNIGGDDYIKKPYTLSVLLAKVKVILKRMSSTENKCVEETADGFVIDHEALRVYRNGRDVGLKNKEFKLFIYLYQNKGKVITKDELFAKVWGDEFFSDGTLNVHIRKIREKIENNPNEPDHIKTVWGVGYMFE
ncbi:MAG: response regulator transcription factor [Agathobacter sp.]|nr:response regulator transcription factor [Agathobacter sp.]